MKSKWFIMCFLITIFVFCLFSGVITAQNIKITGDKSLDALLKSDNLVTVILKNSGAQDVNLKLIEVHPEYLVFESEKEERVTYKLDQISEIIIQKEKREKTSVQIMPGITLRTEDRMTVERAWVRVEEIYKSSESNQDLKVECAVLLTLHNSQEASEYLQKLLDANEISTQLVSARGIYLTGGQVPTALLRSGLEHGNRAVRIQSTILSGLVGYRDGIPSLMNMLQDRSGEISGPAARALAMLGVREIIPKLLEMLSSQNEDKSESAVYAFVELGGEDIKEQLRQIIPNLQGMAQYRAIKALFFMKDPNGKALLSQIFEDQVTLRPEIALLLAREQEWKAQQFLRTRLTRRENPTDSNFIYRARAITALYEGGDPTVLPQYQELMREGSPVVRKEVCKLIFKLGDKNLLKILPSLIENREPEVAFEACRAAIGVTLPEYRKRYIRLKGEL
ncbi:MAG TPA: hypothetical protein PLJ10_01365 [Candidatus Hydrogenedens sp.]|nr:hypothetical protein [Candidatus Hydrogenedens sp.]